MRIQDNAFYVLGASIFDNRRKIAELADEKSLFVDADKCSEAKNALLNPQKRLSAEMRWFIGCSREEEALATAGVENIFAMDDINLGALLPLTQINIMLYQSRFWSIDDIAGIKYITLQLSRLFEQIDTISILDSINSARREAGFSEISELHGIENELRNIRQEIQHTLAGILNGLSLDKKIEAIQKIVEKSADDHKYKGSSVIDDLVAFYALDIDRELQRQKQQISELAGNITKNIDQISLITAIEDLISLVKKWDTLAQPLQLNNESKGLVHKDSEELAYELRQLAISLQNDHQKTQVSLRLVTVLREVFAELPEFVLRIDEDITALKSILAQKNARSLPISRDSRPAPQKKSSSKWGWGILIIIAGIWLFSSLDGNSGSNNSKPSTTSAPPSTPTAPALVEKTMPNNGSIIYSKYTDKPCLFEIENNSDSAYYMKFVDISTGSDAIIFFVRPNCSASIDMPVGNFELRYAYGKTWYGKQDLFGSNTIYAKDEEPYPFESDAYSSTIWTVSFYGANNDEMDTMYTESIDANDF